MSQTPSASAQSREKSGPFAETAVTKPPASPRYLSELGQIYSRCQHFGLLYTNMHNECVWILHFVYSSEIKCKNFLT